MSAAPRVTRSFYLQQAQRRRRWGGGQPLQKHERHPVLIRPLQRNNGQRQQLTEWPRVLAQGGGTGWQQLLQDSQPGQDGCLRERRPARVGRDCKGEFPRAGRVAPPGMVRYLSMGASRPPAWLSSTRGGKAWMYLSAWTNPPTYRVMMPEEWPTRQNSSMQRSGKSGGSASTTGADQVSLRRLGRDGNARACPTPAPISLSSATLAKESSAEICALRMVPWVRLRRTRADRSRAYTAGHSVGALACVTGWANSPRGTPRRPP